MFLHFSSIHSSFDAFLLPDFSVHFWCSLVVRQCLCTYVVSAAVSGRTDLKPCLWPKVESSSSVSQGPLQLLRVALLLDCTWGCLHRCQGRRGLQTFPPILVWNISAIFGSLSFSGSNRMRGLFVKRLVCSFNLIVVSTRSWSLPMSALGKDLLFALLMLDLKRWDVKMNSTWSWTYPLGAC